MAKWTLEPGHTAVEFCVRHMMVTWVRGSFKNVRGSLEFDPARLLEGSLEAEIDAKQLYTGDAGRDAHLRSADFLDVERHPTLSFRGSVREVRGETEFTVGGDITVRGVAKPLTFLVTYLGQWETPFWDGGADKGPITRAGFHATAIINRHDFGVDWNAPLSRDGVVVGRDVLLTLDAEALLEKPDLVA